MTVVFDEAYRLLMLGILVTLLPLALSSLCGVFLQALFQIQESISLQLLRLGAFFITLLIAGRNLFASLRDFFELIQNQFVP